MHEDWDHLQDGNPTKVARVGKFLLSCGQKGGQKTC